MEEIVVTDCTKCPCHHYSDEYMDGCCGLDEKNTSYDALGPREIENCPIKCSFVTIRRG